MDTHHSTKDWELDLPKQIWHPSGIQTCPLCQPPQAGALTSHQPTPAAQGIDNINLIDHFSPALWGSRKSSSLPTLTYQPFPMAPQTTSSNFTPVLDWLIESSVLHLEYL